MSVARAYPLKFQIGARTLLTVRRRLVRHALSLDDVLAGCAPELPPLPAGAHGYVLNSLPAALTPDMARAGLRPFVRQAYVRYWADLTRGFDAYLAAFSGKSRATVMRKVRRFGTVDVRMYRAPGEMADYFAQARAVSRTSYQERLLDAGLPDDLADLEALAARDLVRGFLLFHEGRAIAYLHLPARGDTLIYAYLGFDPDMRDLSPGTVLQFEAMRMLMAEGRFARLDFTEGEGQHKRLFATGGVDCVDLMLLRPTLGNRAVAAALGGFDRLVAGIKTIADRPSFRPLARAVRR